MATPIRAQDPTATALSAIEEALNLEPADAPPANNTAEGQANEAEAHAEEAALGAGVQLPKARTTPIDDWTAPDLNLPEHGDVDLSAHASEPMQAAAVVDQPAVPPRPTPRETAPLTPSVPAANENRQSVGAILQAMRIRPSPAPIIAALVLSIVWAAVCAAYLASHRDLIVPGDGVPLYRRPELGFAILGILGPIVFMFVTALMARRANEMRLTARSMTEVAIRLAEPETVATEQVVSLSQAIRREVASLGDGIERALARASELETMMRSEVSNLERSYSDNERRVRSLIDGLSQQREEIVINSEKVRTAIVGAHESLSRDLATTSLRLAETVSEAGSRVTASLGSKSEEIAFALSRTGSDLVQTLSDHGNDLVQRLAETGESATRQLSSVGDGVAQTLGERIGDIDTRLRTTSEALLTEFETRGVDVTQRLEELGQHFSETVVGHGEHIATRLTETGDRVHDTVNHAHEAFAQSSERLGGLLTGAQERLRLDLETHADQVHTRLATTIADTAAALSAHTSALHEQFAGTAEQTVSALAGNTAAVQERFSATAEQTAAALASHMDTLEQAFASTAERTVSVMDEHTTTLQERFATTASDAIVAIGTHSDRVHQAMADRLHVFEDTILHYGSEADQRLEHHTEHLSGVLGERLVAFEEAITRVANDSDGRIGAHAERLTGTMNLL